MCIHVEAFKDEFLPHDFELCTHSECDTNNEHCAYLYCGAPRNHLVHNGGNSNIGRFCKQCAENIGAVHA